MPREAPGSQKNRNNNPPVSNRQKEKQKAISAINSAITAQQKHNTYTLSDGMSFERAAELLQNLGLSRKYIAASLGNVTDDVANTTLSNIIATARGQGISTADILNALQSVDRTKVTDINGNALTVGAIRKFNNAELPKNYQTILNKINNQYPDAKAYGYKVIDDDGNISYSIRYRNPSGKSVAYNFKDIEGFSKLNGSDLNNWYNSSTLKQRLDEGTFLNNQINAAQGSLNLSNAALAALRGSVGSGANAYQGMSAADRAAVTAKLPGTNRLTAYNKLNGVDIVPNITGNQDISGTIQRRALAELMGLGDQVLDENDDVRQRNIRTQQAALLQQIQQDPELYNALVQRFRADSAAGVTAGQRAANAGDVVNQSQAGYTEAAQNLYDSLFKPDGEIAKTRDEALSTQQSALDQYITGQLNNARKDAVDAGTQATDLRTAMDALSEVFGVDVSKYANDILEASAAKDTKASDILARIAGNSQTTLANQDAALQQILNTYNLGNNLASTGASGSTDVSSALGVIMRALQKPASTGAGFKTVSTPDYKKAKQFNNQQYNDVLNSEYMDYLDPDVIKRMGSSKSLDDILSEYGLDMLSEEGLKTLYTQYAEDANKRSDQVFNAAQRAYIAAITAGDAKTSEQLTRLAQNTSGARSNLYATEALANQFKQQRANANTGLQMATDVQNQRSANANAVNKAALQANSALSSYLGTGADGYDKSTLYAIGSLWDQAAAANRQSYGTLSNSIMQGVQNMNTQNVQNSVNNANRLAQLAAGITSANAAAAANNAANTASRNTAITQAKASKTQAERDLEKLTKLK